MLLYAVILLIVIRFRPAGILGWYMHSGVKKWFDRTVLRKPDIEILEEVQMERISGKEAR